MIELGDGDVETRAQPVLQAAQHLPLVLERMRVGNVNFQGQETDRHLRTSPTSVSREHAARVRRVASRQNQLLHREALEHVADLHVVEIRDAHAALEASAHFAGIFLESPQ